MKETVIFTTTTLNTTTTKTKHLIRYVELKLEVVLLIWGRQTYRWSDDDFEANLRDGIVIDWPVRYKDIARGIPMLKNL